MENIINLTHDEIESVDGGIIPAIIAVAFLKGALTGATAAGLGLAVLDVLDVVDVF
jgi:lactobin A/cerein 7B family class IIb bacteriocin